MNKIQEVQEDKPVCRTEKIVSCSGNSTSCHLVPVNRCYIESSLVRKAQPETRCERIPSKVCGMVKCKKGRVECQEEVVTRVEDVPVESCQLQEVCQEREDPCRTIVRRICRRARRGRRVCRKRNNNNVTKNSFKRLKRKRIRQVL